MRFKVLVPLPVQMVWDLIRPGSTRKWDKSISSFTVLEKISEDLLIARVLTNSVMLGTVSPREFIDMMYTKKTRAVHLHDDYDEIHWTVAKSLKGSKFPGIKKYVRGMNYGSGYAVAASKSDPQKTYIEGYLDTDIGGMLPVSIIERALPGQQFDFFEGLVKEAKKRRGRSQISL